jgi:hypothetical protein
LDWPAVRIIGAFEHDTAVSRNPSERHRAVILPNAEMNMRNVLAAGISTIPEDGACSQIIADVNKLAWIGFKMSDDRPITLAGMTIVMIHDDAPTVAVHPACKNYNPSGRRRDAAPH